MYENNLQFALDYLVGCDQGDNIVYMIGDGSFDHVWWGSAEVYMDKYELMKGETERPYYTCEDSCIQADMAAALCTGYLNFKDSKPEKAKEYLEHAIDLFDRADKLRAIGDDAAEQPYYKITTFYDDLFYAANWLYMATGEQKYLDLCKTDYIPNLGKEEQSSEMKYTWGMCWDDVMQGGVLLYAINTGESQWKDQFTKHLEYWTTGYGGKQITYTPDGLPWLFQWGSLRHATTTAFLAYVAVDQLYKDDTAKAEKYTKFADNVMNYCFGDNSKNFSYVVGMGDDYPQAWHHRTSSGAWNDKWSNIGQTEGEDAKPHAHILYGATLQAVTALLGRYPEVFDPAVNPEAVRIAVTGRVPAPEDFGKYPAYVRFDGNWETDYTPDQLERIALVSVNFRTYSQWNGKGSIIPAERVKLEKIIDRAHGWGKPVRFWGAPEGTTVYYTFYDMGIDYINTDRPEVCAGFFDDFGNKNFQIGQRRTAVGGVTGTKRLDKTTRDFRGFQNDKLQLTEGVDVYTPTYRNDGGKGKVKNVIYLIGDGMGLSQIVAAFYANKGLTTLQMKYMGLQQNNALDAFTTDSAAGGSALATGERHDNRHISMSSEGEPYPSLSDFFHDKGMPVGVLTLGNVADATPTAFYGHSVERDNADELTRCLMDGRVDLLCGSGIREFTRRSDGVELISELKKQYDFVRSVDEINARKGKVICIDETMDDAAEQANLTLLADATRASIAKLQEQGGKGFFLMVEGAKIDYAGHSRCLPGSIIEMLSFDLAVAEALKFADRNGETLVVVTADHETGGLVLVDGDERTGRVMGVYVSDDHTPAMLPVFAYGPGADKFCGTYMNTEIARRIKSLIK